MSVGDLVLLRAVAPVQVMDWYAAAALALALLVPD
jgi:hypothetical protein